ncbi:hypothetical protein Q7P37_006745 [Cladosporium fusiforme]
MAPEQENHADHESGLSTMDDELLETSTRIDEMQSTGVPLSSGETGYLISTAPSGGKRIKKKAVKTAEDDDEPLVDTTANLTLHSKKTERMQKRLEKKSKKKPKAKPQSFLDLPFELLHDIFTCLQPRDLICLQRLNKSTQAFIHDNESTLAKEIIRCRYSILAKCFTLPIPFAKIDPIYHPALLSTKRQDLLAIHKKPYQHIQPLDPLEICTCMTCVFAWNNLCTIADLAHWQPSLDKREPIPMIPRGQTPTWNLDLLARNANLVRSAMAHPLVYASLLAMHLDTTSRTILRRSKYIKTRPLLPEHRLYQLSLAEAACGSDAYLARKGPPSYEFPYHRDNYYNLEAYVPNRKWSREEECWKYYAATQHDRDLEWVRDRFGPEEDGERVVLRVAELGERLKKAPAG